MLLVPVDDGVKVLIAGQKVAKGWMLGPRDNCILDRRCGWKVHVGHPHWNGVKAFLGLVRGEAAHANRVDCQGIMAAAVQEGLKIVFFHLVYLDNLN